MVQLEQFLLDPKLELSRLLAFVELEDTGDLLPAAQHSLPRGSVSSEKWFPLVTDPNKHSLRTLSREKALQIEKVVEPLATRLGYFRPNY